VARVLRFDAGTLQKPRRTSQGYLRVDGWASRAGLQEYRNPDGSKRIELRDDDAVFSDDSLTGFEGAPITDDHPSEMVNIHNAKNLTKGTVLSVGRRDGDHVAVSLIVTDPALIAKIESGKRQLSTGYYVEMDETPGVHPKYGRYDARQVRVGPVNHLAFVERGRAGTAAVRMDAAVDVRFDDEEMPADLVARLEALARRIDEWDEDSHPRAENGQFGSGGGGGGSKKEAAHETRNRGWDEPSPQSSPKAEKSESSKVPLLNDNGSDREESAAARLRVNEKYKELKASGVPHAEAVKQAQGAAKKPAEVKAAGKEAPPPGVDAATWKEAGDPVGNAEDRRLEREAEKELDEYRNSKEPLEGEKFQKLIDKAGLKQALKIAKDVESRLSREKAAAKPRSRDRGFREVTGPAKEKFMKAEGRREERARTKDLNTKDREREKRRKQGRSPALRDDSLASDLLDANPMPQSGSPMTLEAALKRIEDLEAKLDAFPTPAEEAPVEEAEKKCPSCGAMNAADAEECSECGAAMAAPKMDAADVARLEGELVCARKDADEAKTAAQAALEAHALELVKVRKDAEESAAKALRESLDVLTKARAILGTDAKLKLDGKLVDLLDAPLRAVKCAVVKRVDNEDVTPDKHNEFVSALFERAVKTYAKGAGAAGAARQVIEAPREDAAEEKAPANPEKAAAEANKHRISSAWMATDK
jgi:hypothetical protein